MTTWSWIMMLWSIMKPRKQWLPTIIDYLRLCVYVYVNMTSHIQINKYFIRAGVFIKGLRIMKFHLNIKTCSLCTWYTEYYCHSWKKDLCLHCKAVHVIDLDTTHHTVTIYREKNQNLSIRHTCVMHNNKLYNKYCEPCEVPMCDSCSHHCHKPRIPSFLPVSFPKNTVSTHIWG